MPRQDGTGPMGFGPRTGRGVGPCGFGAGPACSCRGCGCGYRRFASPKNELSALENEEKMLEEELSAVREEKKTLENK